MNKLGNVLKVVNTDDRLHAYFMGKLPKNELSTVDLEISKRILSIWTLLTNYHSPQQAVTAHLIQNPKISLRTAWYDYRRATRLFGSIAESSQKANWILLQEYAMQTFKLAADKKKTAEMSAALKNLVEITKMLDDRSEDIQAPSLYVLEMTFIGSKEKKSISLDSAENIEDIQFKELIEGVENEELSSFEIKSIISESGGKKDS